MSPRLSAIRREYMGRASVRLGNGEVAATIDLDGGMVPEFGMETGSGLLNTHWIPDFRDPTGEAWDEGRHGGFWKSRLLHTIAGDFPCCPNFGPPCRVDGVELPPHGWTANSVWDLLGLGVDEEAGASYADFGLESPDPGMPLSMRRRDFMLEGQGVLFSSLAIHNAGRTELAINLAHHNTLGGDFLRPGCRISLCAESFMTAPRGTEFDASGRLAQGEGFTSLRNAPLRNGGMVDLSLVPGMIGYTDFVTGAVPAERGLGWSCVVNPALGLAYLCLFPGSRDLPPDELSLSFNDLWMQYGGRPFTPWAKTEGGPDRSFCLGTENASGAYANGLDYSRANPSLLGRPTMATIPARGTRILHYALALLRVDRGMLEAGVEEVENEGETLVLRGGGSERRYAISSDFQASRRLCLGLGQGRGRERRP